MWHFVPSTEDVWKNGTTPLAPFDNSIFMVSDFDHGAIADFVSSMFNFSYGTDDSGYTIGPAFEWGTNVSAVVANITAAMTDVVRTGQNYTLAQGVVWGQQTVIEIQWAWLSLPIALVLISTALLVFTMASTHRSRVPLWKSSVLPLMYHGVQDWDEDDRQELLEGMWEQKGEMESRAKLVNVRLGRVAQGGTMLTKSD